MINLENFTPGFLSVFEEYKDLPPWEIISKIPKIIDLTIPTLSSDFMIKDGIAIHKEATIESNVTLKAPVIICGNCFIGANAYLRGGVFLAEGVKIGTGCEIKSSMIFNESAVAHFNFIGDSIIGSRVNFEAGSITANHFNERVDKAIKVYFDSKIIETNVEKFGALVGDNSKIGANAVLSPGTILFPDSIVARLQLVDQSKK